MEWFNVYGLAFMAVIMIPNVIFAIKGKAGDGKWKNKAVEVAEQIGRFGCLAFMVFNIPYTWFGWWSADAFAVYLIVNAILIVAYCIIWAICWNRNGLFKALALSVIPAVVFLFSGIMSRSILLLVSALIFASTHVLISYKNR